MKRRRLPWALVAAVLTAPVPRQGGATTGRELVVFAAASLTGPFDELAAVYRKRHSDVTVRLSYAGSQQLASQLELGATADVFASADERWMDRVERSGLLREPPVVFARNRLVAVIPASNPGRIEVLEDLARPGLRLVLAAEAVPAGRYSREALRRLARLPGFPRGYDRRVLANVVSEEENVKAVAAKVHLGEADVGLIYRSDVTPALASGLGVLEIPESANVVGSYPVALLARGPAPREARAFVELLLGHEGRSALAKHGFLAPAASP